MRLWVITLCVIVIQGYWDLVYKDTIEAKSVILQQL